MKAAELFFGVCDTQALPTFEIASVTENTARAGIDSVFVCIMTRSDLGELKLSYITGYSSLSNVITTIPELFYKLVLGLDIV